MRLASCPPTLRALALTPPPFSSSPAELIEEAKDEWAAKLARQSTSLAEAVAEYKRRNGGLAPPKGFDHWWAYVQEHEVQLPDEYDRINVDLAPFRGLAPAVLRRRIAELQAPGQGHESFTLAVHGGQASTSHVTYDGASIGGADDRKAGQLALVADVARWLPDFEAVYSIHDAPTRFVSYGHRQDLEFAAEDGEYLDPAVEVDVDGHSWAAACPYGSPLRKDGPQPVPAGKSFIKSHTASMDLCSHPSVPALHGLTLGLTPAPQAELLPLFSLSKTGLHADILGIPVEQWLESASDDGATAWSEKTDDRLLWRGRNTGGVFSADVDWRSSHRARLTATSGDDVKGSFPVLPSPGEADGSRTLANATLDRSLASLNRAMLDVGLAYDPIQCVEEDGSCQAIADELTFRPVKTFEEEVAFRYILDVDGNVRPPPPRPASPSSLPSVPSLTCPPSSFPSLRPGPPASSACCRPARSCSKAPSSPSGGTTASSPGTVRRPVLPSSISPPLWLSTELPSSLSCSQTTSPSRSTTRTCTTRWPSSEGPTPLARSARTHLRRRSPARGSSGPTRSGARRT